MPRPNWEKEYFCCDTPTSTTPWGMAPSNKRLEQPQTALSCAKNPMGSRTEADPRSEAASLPKHYIQLDTTNQSPLFCVPVQLKILRLACVHPFCRHWNLLYSNSPLPYSFGENPVQPIRHLRVKWSGEGSRNSSCQQEPGAF